MCFFILNIFILNIGRIIARVYSPKVTVNSSCSICVNVCEHTYFNEDTPRYEFLEIANEALKASDIRPRIQFAAASGQQQRQ